MPLQSSAPRAFDCSTCGVIGGCVCPETPEEIPSSQPEESPQPSSSKPEESPQPEESSQPEESTQPSSPQPEEVPLPPSPGPESVCGGCGQIGRCICPGGPDYIADVVRSITQAGTGNQGIDAEGEWRVKAGDCEHKNLGIFIAHEGDQPTYCDIADDRKDERRATGYLESTYPDKHPATEHADDST